MYCQNCGKEIDKSAVVCVHCGCATRNFPNNNNDKMKCNRFTAIFLALFFGHLGFARFYHNEIFDGFWVLFSTCTSSFAISIFNPDYFFIPVIIICFVELIYTCIKSSSECYTTKDGGCLYMFLAVVLYIVGTISLWILFLPVLFSQSY